MSNKKLLLGSLCAASLLSAQAFANNWDGFYVAGSLQLVDFSQEVEHVSGDKSGLNTSAFNNSLEETTSGVNSFGAEIAAGYGLAFSDSPWALDFEVFYQETSAEIELPLGAAQANTAAEKDGLGQVSSTLDNTFGARVKPGYFIAPNVKLFAPLGIVQSDIENEYAINNSEDGDFNLTEDEEAIGFQVGLGLETMLNPDVSLAVSVARTFYDEYSVDVTSGNTVARETFDPSVTNGSVTVIYRF